MLPWIVIGGAVVLFAILIIFIAVLAVAISGADRRREKVLIDNTTTVMVSDAKILLYDSSSIIIAELPSAGQGAEVIEMITGLQINPTIMEETPFVEAWSHDGEWLIDPPEVLIAA